MNRITSTLDERCCIVRICAGEEVQIASPHVPHDRVCRWSSIQVGPDHAEGEIGGWPESDMVQAAQARRRQEAAKPQTGSA